MARASMNLLCYWVSLWVIAAFADAPMSRASEVVVVLGTCC